MASHPLARRPISLMMLATVAALAGAGCAREPAPPQNPARLPSAEPEQVRQAAREVLRDLYFEVEHPPRAAERIDTLPMTSAYPLEVWRNDVRTAQGWVETALHTVRRTASVIVQPEASAGGAPVTVEVVVRRERPVLPEGLDATTVNEAYHIFVTQQEALERFEQQWGRGITWVDYGRDPELEGYILNRLAERLGEGQ